MGTILSLFTFYLDLNYLFLWTSKFGFAMGFFFILELLILLLSMLGDLVCDSRITTPRYCKLYIHITFLRSFFT